MRDLCGAESVCECGRAGGVEEYVSIAQGRGLGKSQRVSCLEGLRLSSLYLSVEEHPNVEDTNT